MCRIRYLRRTILMTFDVEVYGLNEHQESLLLDRIIETIKEFGVESDAFRIFLDDDLDTESDCCTAEEA